MTKANKFHEEVKYIDPKTELEIKTTNVVKKIDKSIKELTEIIDRKD